MSTYDAYNLSLRDSTEFTVPTGSGSSGDSQFNTVTLTIVNTSENSTGNLLFVPYVDANGNAASVIREEPIGESTYIIILCNGKAQLWCTPIESELTTSGNISYIELEGSAYYEITGDCTITSDFGGGK